MPGLRVKDVVRYFFVMANVMAAALLIASAYSDRVAPEKTLLFSYLGLVFPLICFLNAGFIVCWAFLGRWKYLLLGIAFFAVCWNPVRSYFPVHLRGDVPQGNVIKVLTYNVMGFAYASDPEKDAPNRIISYIAGSEADIVCLQEYFINRRPDGLTARKIKEALKMYPYSSVVNLKNFGWGLAVYSKYPITASRRIEYDSRDNGSSIHLITVNGKTLTLINNHLESFKLTSEDKVRYLDFIKGAGPETFDSLRSTVQQKLGPAFLRRARQARAVAGEIKESRSDYILVCGDFNDTPVSYAHRTVQGDLLDAFAGSGTGPGVTYNLNYFWFRIDNILHSPNMKAYRCTVDHIDYSDHYPVWCYLKLN
ncbi:MAG: endonuclease/exonuclease/phosphatase family protein [Tannerellaceae bacterium]|jgi:endonuclease/exonuclease/phosphatase family metal-dependent hydrolase|nr:endonuclease/exonuclease/phosphatase family protein [Tannerellaceae bacterium]